MVYVLVETTQLQNLHRRSRLCQNNSNTSFSKTQKIVLIFLPEVRDRTLYFRVEYHDPHKNVKFILDQPRKRFELLFCIQDTSIFILNQVKKGKVDPTGSLTRPVRSLTRTSTPSVFVGKPVDVLYDRKYRRLPVLLRTRRLRERVKVGGNSKS